MCDINVILIGYRVKTILSGICIGRLTGVKKLSVMLQKKNELLKSWYLNWGIFKITKNTFLIQISKEYKNKNNHTNRQTDKQTDKQERQIETDKQTNNKIKKLEGRSCMGSQTDRQTD